MRPAPPYRLILATALIGAAAGWILGYVMAGSSLPIAGSEERNSEASDRTPAAREGRPVVERFSGSALDQETSPTGSKVTLAEFETQSRGALRLADSTDRLVRLRDLARSLPLADLPAAAELAKRLTGEDRWQLLQAIGARWAEEAPAAAAGFAAKHGLNQHGWNNLLNAVLRKWGEIDAHTAAAWVGTLSGAARLNALQALADSVASQNPQTALDMVQAALGSTELDGIRASILERWSARDPAAAAKAAAAMKPGNSRDYALSQTAKNWAAQDPAGAFAWAESLPDLGTKNQMLRAVAQSWGERDPKAVIAWGSKLADASARREILTGALKQLAQSDVASAEEHLRSLPASFERDGIIHLVAQTAAAQDPKAAMAMAELLPAGPKRIATTAGILLYVASTDPRAAAEIFLTFPAAQAVEHANVTGTMLARANLEVAQAWVDRLPAGTIKSEAARPVAEMMAQANPRAAAEWLTEMAPGADLSWLLEKWAGNAPQDVLAWSKQVSDPDARLAAQRSALQSLGLSDPAQAAKIFAEDLAPDAQRAAAGTLAYQWANHDLNAARAWAESLPAGSTRENALGEFAQAWARQDPAKAAQWIERLSPGEERDHVVTQFARAVSTQDPSGSLQWATSIGHPELRAVQVEQLAARWLKADAAAAREWITNTDHLTPIARRRVLEQRTQSYWD